MNIKKVITHGGPIAHKDEFVAISLALSHYGMVPVLRRDPTADELADPKVMVIDVGEKYQADLHNFDHHQMKGRSWPTCSITLVLRHISQLKGWDFSTVNNLLPWLSFCEWMDSNGPTKTAKWLGMPEKMIDKTICPIASALLGLFGEYQSAGVGMNDEPVSDLLLGMMQGIGDSILDGIGETISMLKELRQSSNGVKSVHGINYMMMPMASSKASTDAIGMYVDEVERSLGASIHVIVSPDNRGDGLSLYRRNDHEDVDFYNCVDHEDVKFAHMGGFIVKTHDDLADVPAILRMARRDEF